VCARAGIPVRGSGFTVKTSELKSEVVKPRFRAEILAFTFGRDGDFVETFGARATSNKALVKAFAEAPPRRLRERVRPIQQSQIQITERAAT
jgi:hypothetical protein